MILLARIGTGLLGAALLTVGVASSQGFLHVHVEEKHPNGTHFRLALPAMVVPLTLRFVPRERLKGAANLRTWLPPMAAAASGLIVCPDGPLVEVTEPGEHVSVVKNGDSLVVDVDNANETVHVSVPIIAAGSTIGGICAKIGCQ